MNRSHKIKKEQKEKNKKENTYANSVGTCHIFRVTSLNRPLLIPEIYLASIINEYQEYFVGGKDGKCIGLTSLPFSCADSVEIWEPQPPGTLRACPGL